MKCYINRVIQLSLVAAAILAAVLLQSNGSVTSELTQSSPENESALFDMLHFLDEKIACQENNKDVRCWSSVNKLQMFVAGAAIEHDAVGVRIEKYHELIENVWQTAASQNESEISDQQLLQVLSDEFPHKRDESTGKVTFHFADDSNPILVMNDLVKDYSDTIETWRLLQSWAAAKVNANGDLQLSPTFSQAAVEEFHEFLSSFDIALFKRAKQIANSRKLIAVDAESMALAFRIHQSSIP